MVSDLQILDFRMVRKFQASEETIHQILNLAGDVPQGQSTCLACMRCWVISSALKKNEFGSSPGLVMCGLILSQDAGQLSDRSSISHWTTRGTNPPSIVCCVLGKVLGMCVYKMHSLLRIFSTYDGVVRMLLHCKPKSIHI